MTMDFGNVPLWAAIVAAVFFVIGAGLTLLGTVGLATFPSFYTRIHAPTLGTSWGAGGMVMGSMIVFSAASGRPVLHDILIGVFATATTPVTLMMLGRASLYRDRSEGSTAVPPVPESTEPPGTVPDATPAERPSV